MVISKKDGIDHSVGALGGLNRALQGFLTSPVNSVRKNNERFATLLLLHQFVGGQENGIVKQSAAAMHPLRTTGGRIRRRSAATSAVAVGPGRLQRPKSGLQFVTRGSEILEQLHLSVKMNDECLVFGSSEHLIQETLARRSLLIQNIPLTHAGVDKQSKREGKVGFLRKIANRLRATIFLEEEIVFGQIADDLAMLVPDSDG
jgi:hypothetical protein